MSGWGDQFVVAANVVGWVVMFILILGIFGWLFFYYKRHPYTVKIIDLRTTAAGNFLGKKDRDKGGIYINKGVPYLHLMKRFKMRNLREPLPHERDFDGEITLLRLADNYYKYAPARIYVMGKEGNAEGEQEKETNGNVLMQPNPNFDPSKPRDNPANTPFKPVEDDSVELTEGHVRQLVDESQKDAFRADFRNVLETTTRKKDNTGLWINVGLFAINATIFVLIMVITGR